MPCSRSFSEGLIAQPRQLGNGRAAQGHGGHLRFDFLPLLFFALDVDVPNQQLGGQPHVLAFLADGERQLGIIHDDFQVFLPHVEDGNVIDFRRAQGVGGEHQRDLRCTR